MHILLVEDELKAGAYLQKGLSESGYVVDWVTNGMDGLHNAVTETYDLIILDVMLPGMTGWDVLKRVRKEKDTPILFLTACDDVEDRVKGLDLGADDYLVKPFAFTELMARIRTLLRRGPVKESELIEIADLRIDLLKRRVSRAGQRIELTAKEFSLLHMLARHTGEVLARSLIASQVWDMNFDSDTNVVDVAIRRLRSKVDDPFAPKLIHTMRGMGYVLEHRQSP